MGEERSEGKRGCWHRLKCSGRWDDVMGVRRLEGCLSYVFWHRRVRGVPQPRYERALRAFHISLRRQGTRGFLGSASFRLMADVWPGSGRLYEDWYYLTAYSGLGRLNEGAVTGVAKMPHDRVASLATEGTGSLYLLRTPPSRHGERTDSFWFSKPRGMTYARFWELIPGIPGRAWLWQRQLSLGPAQEFVCRPPERGACPAWLEELGVEPRRVGAVRLVQTL